MATLDNIVNVQIALQTTGVVRGDFGTPMIVSPLMTFTERVRVYNSYLEASGDDLPPSLLTALSDCFGQIPRPRLVKVGRRAISGAVVTVSEVTNLADYTVTIGETDYTYTADATATAAEIVAGLETAIDGVDAYVAASASGELAPDAEDTYLAVDGGTLAIYGDALTLSYIDRTTFSLWFLVPDLRGALSRRFPLRPLPPTTSPQSSMRTILGTGS